MIFRERKPSPALATDVECLWAMAGGTAGGAQRVFPDGCIELVFHLGGRFASQQAGEVARTQPAACLVGALTRPLWLHPAPDVCTVGVRFRPGGAVAYFGAELDACADRVVPLEERWGAEAQVVSAQLAALAGDAARWAALETELLARRGRGRLLSPGTRCALDLLLATRGVARVETVARATGWSARHLERRFAREVGLGPKAFARTVRFQNLCATLGNDPGGDWAGVAWDCGFADQAHLIREFRRFTGTTPRALQDPALALGRRFVSPARLEAYFASSRPASSAGSDSFYRPAPRLP